jgi:tetratricopeptide (TPR) repeat protein
MHVEAVTFTTAAFDTLAMVFGMLSVWSFLRAKIAPTEASRWWRWLSYGAAILAVGGNELTLVLPVLVMLVDLKGVSVNLWSEVRKRWKTYIPYWLIVSVYSYIRFIYLGVGARAPYQAYSMYYSVLSSIKAYAKYLEILVWPVKLNYNHMLPGDIAAHTLIEINSEAILKQRFSDTPILFSLMVIGVLVWLAVKLWRNSRFLSLGIAWTLIGLLPGINLYPNASQFQERYAYMASLGFCLAIGFGLAEIYSWLNRKAGTHKATVLMTVVLIGISGYYGYRTYTRNIDWRSEVAIWAKTLEDSPDNAIVVYKLGSAYRDEGKLDKAKKWYLQSLELYPNLVEAMNNLGVIAEKSGELGEARKYYEQALKLRPGMSELYNNLGVIELREKNNNQAVSLFTRAIELNPEYVQAQQNLIKAQAEWE